MTACKVRVVDDAEAQGFSSIDEEETLEIKDIKETEERVVCESETVVSMIYVYVCGQVRQPDVYQLPADARQYQAIEAAGGVAEDACTDYMNLAETLSDGQRLYVPTTEEAMRASASQDGQSVEPDDEASTGLVNINTADLQTLMTLPGIGETKAKRIIEHRTSHGAFQCTEDLMQVSGIGKATYEALSDWITT